MATFDSSLNESRYAKGGLVLPVNMGDSVPAWLSEDELLGPLGATSWSSPMNKLHEWIYGTRT